MTDVAAAPAQAEETQAAYSIEKIYVKDLSLEVPNAPQIFLEREAPQVDVQLHHASKGVDEGIYQTELTITVTAKIGEKTMFLAEVCQAGILRFAMCLTRTWNRFWVSVTRTFCIPMRAKPFRTRSFAPASRQCC